MSQSKHYDVIIIGGSYSGLSAALALGRALRQVLLIDSGQPCNAQTPHSHNFLTQDGSKPSHIAAQAREQVSRYSNVSFINGLATGGEQTAEGFRITIQGGEAFTAGKLIFATGIRDLTGATGGLAECWGISVIHCPYCHGYEVHGQTTGILGNGEYGFEFSRLISNWTKDLTLYTNGPCTLTKEEAAKLEKNNIRIVEKAVSHIEHDKGMIRNLVFTDGTLAPLKVLYTRPPFAQHCPIPEKLGCRLNSLGYIDISEGQRTSLHGVFACGDSTTIVRSVANAVFSGNMAGICVNRELIEERF